MKRFLGTVILACAFFVGNAEAGKYGNGSGKTTSTTSSKSTPRPSPTPSSPKPSPKPSESKSSDVGSKPKNNTYDSAAAADKRKDDSQARWQASQDAKKAAAAQPQAQPRSPQSPSQAAQKPSYTTPNGTAKPVEDKQAAYLRGRLDESRYQHRDDRYRFFYGTRYSYYATRPRVYYDDGYASSFSWWLREQNYRTQAQYAYHHHDDMDTRRFNDIMSNPGIADEYRYIEMQNTPRDPFWTPTGMDYDLMRSDSYVNSVYHTQNVTYNSTSSSSGAGAAFLHGLWVFVKWVFYILVLIAMCIFLFWSFQNWENKVKWWFFKKPAVETTVLNPLKIKEEQYVSLNTLDEQGVQFRVDRIDEMTRVLHGNTHKSVDYELESLPTAGKSIRMRVRMNPAADKFPAGMNQRILKLQLTDDDDWNEDLYNLLTTEPDGKKADDADFIEYEEDGTTEKAKWWRINGIKESYHATIKTIDDGKITESKIEFWDFYRDMTGESGKKKTQYLFVEMDKGSHTFEFWTGEEIDESEIA